VYRNDGFDDIGTGAGVDGRILRHRGGGGHCGTLLLTPASDDEGGTLVTVLLPYLKGQSS